MSSILKVKNLKKIYHSKTKETLAVSDFNFDFQNNEFISIVGPSGCGKSTILSIIGNLEDKTSGDILYDKNITIGYMLQEDALFDWLSVLDNCLLGLKIKNKLTKENKDYVIGLLNKYGLKEFINAKPNSLSGGMRQRVALIRTLALRPDILLLDEPFSALDYQTRLKVSNDVFEIIKNENKSAIMVTHDIGEAIAMSDRIILLTKRPGKIKKVYNINLTNKSNPILNRAAKEFSKYYDIIWKDLDYYE